MRAKIFDIQSYALYDGPGIRTCVYFKGCPLRCNWCHNPEAMAPGHGESVDLDALVEQLERDAPFFEASGGGVTISGGEPTLQGEALLALLGQLRAKGMHTAVETSGYFEPALAPALAERVDLFLFDLKQIDCARHLEGTGVDNQRILENFVALLGLVGQERIQPRIPVIPGFNDGPEDIAALIAFLLGAGYRGEVELMPFHRWAKDKYRRLGREREFVERAPLTAAARARITDAFMETGDELTPRWSNEGAES